MWSVFRFPGSKGEKKAFSDEATLVQEWVSIGLHWLSYFYSIMIVDVRFFFFFFLKCACLCAELHIFMT